MKKQLPTAAIFGILFLLNIIVISCAKDHDSSSTPKEQLVVAHWNINRIQLRLYYGGVFYKDTILPQTPQPENYVSFDASGNFEYRFNKTTADVGTYQFVGLDSLVATTPGKIYRWKWLTLTDYLLTLKSTSSNDPAFPGATVETYHTVVH